LPNEVVVEELQRQARVQARIREPESNTDTDDADADAEAQQQEDDKDAGSTQTAASSSSSAAAAAAVVDAWVFADSAEAQLRLARLPCLQLGCGNSEVTALLWEECGLRSLHNVDFSPACIERMQSLQKERGWITDPAIAAAAASDAVAAVSSAGSTAAAAAADVLSIASTVGAGFTFRVMDVRALQYPSNCFSLVFDKGTLDCVSLESSGDSAPGESSRAMLREIWRVLRPGGVCVCFSLYPPSARGLFFLAAAGESGESDAELTEWAEEVLSADNPPQVLRDTAAWSELRMQPLDISPLELPNQQHTYLYVAVKR
jgi:ubiquinone/menaquinone biosynthesis C-methylase UbiE